MKTKIPPPIITLVLIILVFFSKDFLIIYKFKYTVLLTLFFLGLGLIISTIPIIQFIKSKTTISPVKINNASNLVTNGIYRISRNPMYLGMLFFIISITIYYLNLFSILVPIFFILYITYFQILPEEKILKELFKDEYIEYKKRVRRWI